MATYSLYNRKEITVMTMEQKKELVEKIKAENPGLSKGPLMVRIGRAFNEIKIKELHEAGSSAEEIVSSTGIPEIVVKRVLATC